MYRRSHNKEGTVICLFETWSRNLKALCARAFQLAATGTKWLNRSSRSRPLHGWWPAAIVLRRRYLFRFPQN